MHPTLARIERLLSELFKACLLACLATGAVLLFQYRPTGDVQRGVEAITTLIPFGFFFRRVHFASGQACALLALAHVLLRLGGGGRMRTGIRLRLAAALGICFALPATGFILKADAEARLAGTVLRSLAESIPLAGGILGGMVAGHGESFFLPPYVLHCFALPAALAALAAGHLRRMRPAPGAFLAAILGLGFWGTLVPMPPAPPPGAPLLQASGPWFLYGMQEALRLAPPLAVAAALAALPPALLAGLPGLRGAAGRAARLAFAGGVCLYLALGLILA